MRRRCWACGPGKWPLSGRYGCCVVEPPGYMHGQLYRFPRCVVNYSALQVSVHGHWAACCLPTPACAGGSLSLQNSCRDTLCMRLPPVICGNGLLQSGADARYSGCPASRCWSVKYFYLIFRLTGRWCHAGEVDEKCDCLFIGYGTDVE